MHLIKTLCCMFLFAAVSTTAFAGHKKKGAVAFLPDSTAVQRSFSRMFDTLTIRPHERVADIGAQGGDIIPYLNYKYDSLEVHLEDISAQWLNQTRVDTVITYYNREFGRKTTNGYTITIGNDTSTILPAGYFDKIFFINTYHECTRKADMVQELNRICARGGMVIVVEIISDKPGRVRKDCHHIMPTDDGILQVFRANGFSINNVHYRKEARHRKLATYRFVKR